MNSKKAKHLRREMAEAHRKLPDMDVNFATKRAKEDYNSLPRKERESFSIFDRV